MTHPLDLNQLAQHIKQWGQSLGFQQVGICDTDLTREAPRLQRWLDKHYHGEMAWMSHNSPLRTHPEQLLPGTLRVISARMNYLPANASFASTLNNPYLGYISRYALGRDYHKLLRRRLKQLGDKIKQYCSTLNFRPFVDSAPILERPLAVKAGLGWVGKHSLLIHPDAGSWFFLGELLVNIPLPVDTPLQAQCGRCVSCMTICPTRAIVEPYVIDAKRCISYLTIELEGAIPEEFRPLMGNRIYGCDDCQMICPWSRCAPLTNEIDFTIRQPLHAPHLVTLFQWDEKTFLNMTEGSAIRRIGYLRWLRNISVALGNAPYHQAIISLLQSRLGSDSMLDEHLHWAIEQQKRRQHVGHIQNNQQKRVVRAVEKGLPRDA